MTEKMIFAAATNNENKLREMRTILKNYNIELLSTAQANVGQLPEEDGQTFEENARKKAQAAMEASGMPAIADDSGLCIDALGGTPGIYSARLGGENLTDEQRSRLLLGIMQDIPTGERGARFVCAVCAAFPDGTLVEARGESLGEILSELTGESGFGYDPIFKGETGVSFGLLDEDEKRAVSHRARALEALAKKLGRI